MSPITYCAVLKHVGLTQARLARLLKVNPHTTSKWACGHAPIPHAVALLLAAMNGGYLNADDLETLGRTVPYEE